MRKKQTLLVCAVCALLAILAILAYTSTTAEPSYAGHPLNYWVGMLSRSRNPAIQANRDLWYKPATNAIDNIGVAAIPFLIKWIQGPPQWRLTLASWLNRTPFPPARKLSGWIYDSRRAAQLASGTYVAFDVLGKRAMPALNDLSRLAKQTNAPQTARQAVFDLGRLGPNALPPLITVATNAQHPARLAALGVMDQMSDLGDAAQLAVLAFTNCLTATNDVGVQTFAIAGLGNLRASPQISVPALIPFLKSTNVELRGVTAMVLGQFGPQATSAIPALTNVLTDSDPRIRNNAAWALHEIDPATFTNASLSSFQQ